MSPADALHAINARISAAERGAGRTPGSVTLVAVSKGFAAASIAELAAAGQRRFGESYLNEAIPKIDALSGLDLEWHFVGPVQSNKTRKIAARFDWVHGIDRLKIAERLSAQRPPELPPLNLCIQVNISAESGKSGIAPAAASELVRSVNRLPRLRVRGLMGIPAVDAGPADLRLAFRRLRELQQRLSSEAAAPELDTLSIGMSDDFEVAISEGADLVRIGTALFGTRDPVRPGRREFP